MDSPLIDLFDDTSGLTAQELRAHRRIDCKIPVILHLGDGLVEEAMILDLSPDGAKLKAPSSTLLPASFEVEGLSQQANLKVSVAWERGGFIGLKIEENWQKLVWHEMELADLLKTAKILNE